MIHPLITFVESMFYTDTPKTGWQRLLKNHVQTCHLKTCSAKNNVEVVLLFNLTYANQGKEN